LNILEEAIPITTQEKHKIKMRRNSAQNRKFKQKVDAAINRQGSYTSPAGKKSVKVDHQTWLIVDEDARDIEVKKRWFEVRADQASALSRKYKKI